MVEFAGLRALRVDDKTARFTFPILPGSPWIECRPALDENPSYKSARLLHPAFSEPSSKESKRTRGGSAKLPGSEKDARTQLFQDVVRKVSDAEKAADYDLFPEHIFVRWGGWTDRDGAEIPFSVANGRELVRQLPEYLFDQLRSFCKLIENFVEDGHVPNQPEPQALEDLAGN